MIQSIIFQSSKRIALAASSLVFVLCLNSCQDYLDVEPKTTLTEENAYKTITDADAAVFGLYGKFIGLADKYVILNEMRADLMTTTVNSSTFLKQLSEHNVSQDNPYISPKPFYEVINNCNDILKNFDIMLAEKRFTQDEYNQRYADVGCIRSWVYLQLGIHFGQVPYITEPISTLEDAKNSTKYPRISFSNLLDKLILFSEGLEYKKPYNTQSTMVTTVDGYYTAKFFVNKECLLGDLHLWKGNYTKAASYYKNVMETASTSSSDTERYESYRISLFAGSGNNDFLVRYSQADNASSLINGNTVGWRSMYSRTRDAVWNTEWIWSIPYTDKLSWNNPFINFFSKSKGSYLAKPSQSAIDLWNNNKQTAIPYDARGSKLTYLMEGTDPVIMKYQYKSDASLTGPANNGDWMLYRSVKLHLRYAEAANRDNKHRIASALLNNGFQSEYNRGGVSNTSGNVSNIMQTKEPYPYDFDARQGDFPRFRANWHRNGGIRRRANLPPAPVVGDSLTSIENNLINEAALDLAYEGNRWEDLVRVALHRNQPEFLADKIFDKLSKEGNPNASAVRSKLMSVNNWYLPFIW